MVKIFCNYCNLDFCIDKKHWQNRKIKFCPCCISSKLEKHTDHKEFVYFIVSEIRTGVYYRKVGNVVKLSREIEENSFTELYEIVKETFRCNEVCTILNIIPLPVEK